MTHVASLYVQTRADAVASAAAQLSHLGGVELHAADPSGKLVVLLEADSCAAVAARMEQIRDIPGVAAVSLVFHGEDDATPQPRAQDDMP